MAYEIPESGEDGPDYTDFSLPDVSETESLVRLLNGQGPMRLLPTGNEPIVIKWIGRSEVEGLPVWEAKTDQPMGSSSRFVYQLREPGKDSPASSVPWVTSRQIKAWISAE